jgi:hypothetical protein
MNSMILLTALSVGQPGGAPPAVLPMTPAPGTVQPMPAPGMPPMGMGGMPPANGNGNGNGEEEKKEEEPPAPEPYALMRLLSTTRFGERMEERGVSISGWVQGNYTLSSNSKSNLPVTFNDRADFWQMNQLFVRLDKAIDTSKSERQFGYRFEGIVPGTDSRFTLARGLFDGQLKAPNPDGSLSNYYPFDLFQAYTDVYLPNLGSKGTTVRVGKFATIIGYELVQGAETPFLQRSYLFQYNPFTHTGVFATTQLNDNWTAGYGLVAGADNFIGDPTNEATFLGQLKWAPKDSKTNVLFNTMVSARPRFDADENFSHYNVYNMVLTHNLSDRLTYVADATFSHIDRAPIPGGGTASATWYGVANYLIYKHCNDKLTSNFRVELFEDTKGFRTGFKGLYTEVTYGLAMEPVRGLIFRPTIRYDYNNNSKPFEGRANLVTAAFDMILRY